MNGLINKMNANRTEGERIEEMRKDVVEALNRSMDSIKNGTVDDRKASVQGLKSVRGELVNLSRETGINSDDMLKSLDTMIEHGEKQVGLMKSLWEAVSPKSNVLSKFKEGFWSEASPFLKLAANVAKGVKGRVDRAGESAADFNELQEASSDIKEAAKGLALEAKNRKDVVSKPTIVPETKEELTPEPKQEVKKEDPQPEPKIEKVPHKEEPLKMQLYKDWNPEEAGIQRLPEETPAEKPKVKKATPERDETGRFKSKLDKPKIQAQEAASKADDASVKAIENLAAVFESRFGNSTPTEGRAQDEKTILESIDKELADIKVLQEQALAMAKQQALEGSKDKLRQKKPGKGILDVKPVGKDGAKPTLIGGAIQSILNGAIGAMAPALLGMLSKGVMGAGRSILKLLNPMNWVRGAQSVFNALKPSNLLAAAEKAGGVAKAAFTTISDKVMGKAKGIAEGVKGGVSVAGKAIEKIGTWGKGLASAAGTLLKGARTIPVVGQVLAAGMAIYDFFTGYSNAAEILGKDASELTTWDKVSSGIGKAVGSVTGIIDSIGSLFGFDWNIEKAVTSWVAKEIADMPDAVGRWAKDAKETFIAMKDVVSGWVSNLMEGAAKAIAENVPGGKWLVDKVGGLFKKDEPLPVKRGDIDKEIPEPANFNNTPATKEMTREEKIEAIAAIDRPTNNLATRTQEHARFMDNMEMQQAQKSEINTNVDNRQSVVNNTTVTTTPLSTRNPDDSHRRGL